MKKKDHEKKQPPKKTPHQTKDFVPSSMLSHLHSQSSLTLPPSPSYFSFPSILKNDKHEPSTPFPEWTSEDEVNSQFAQGDEEKLFIDPEHEDLSLNFPLYLIKLCDNDIQWDRPKEFVINYYIDKEVMRLYPKKNFAVMREDIKKTYDKNKKAMLNIDAENDEEDDDEDINNYLNNDEETMKMTIYKDFFGIIDKSYDIIISNTTTRVESDDEYYKRKESEEKTKKTARKNTKTKIPKPINDEDRLIYHTASPSSLSPISTDITMNSFTSWLTSIYQMIIDLDIRDVTTKTNIVNNIYPHKDGAPVLSSNGKYIIRLYHMGKPRMITIDDRIPCNKDHEYFLPKCNSIEEIWPALLTKGVLKLLTYKTRHPLYYMNEESNDVSVIYALTGMHVTICDIVGNSKVMNMLAKKFEICEQSEEGNKVYYAMFKTKRTSMMKCEEGLTYNDIVDRIDFSKKRNVNGFVNRTSMKWGTIKSDKKIMQGRVSFVFNNNETNLDDDSISSKQFTRKSKRFPTIVVKKKENLHRRKENLILSNNIIANYLYSVVDFFDNGEFNMKRLRCLDFSDLERVLIDKKVQFKQLALNEKKQYLIARRELKKKQLDEKNRRLNELKENGAQYSLIKVAKNGIEINFFNEYTEEEINAAKKCILNQWTYPPYTYFKEFEVKETLKKEEEKKDDNKEQQVQQKKKKYPAFSWNAELYNEFTNSASTDYSVSKTPITSSIKGTWLTVNDMISSFDKLLIIHNQSCKFSHSIIIDNNWSYFERDVFSDKKEYEVIILSSNDEDNLSSSQESSLIVVFEPFTEKIAPNSTIVNALYPYISFDIIDTTTKQKIQSNIILNHFYSIYSFDKLNPKSNYAIMSNGGSHTMGYIAQVMTDRHHIKNMSKNEYMKEYEGYKESISHIEHSAIEGGKFFLIAKFALCSFTNESEENSIQIKDSDDIKIKITIGYPITYIKKYLRMFLIDASTYHQIELEDEGMISLLKSEFDFEAATPRYYIVIYLRCVFTLKEGAFDISLLCDDPRVKFDLIENIDPYEIVDRYENNKNNLIFSYYIYPSEKISASLSINLYHIIKEIKAEAVKEKGKKSSSESSNMYIESTPLENKTKIILELYHLTKEPSLSFVPSSLKFSYSNQGELVRKWNFFSDIIISNINLEGDLIVPSKPSKDKKVQLPQSNPTFPYLLMCYFDSDESDINIRNNINNDIGYTIRVFSSDSIAFIKDTSKEDHEKQMKDDWESKDEGRALRASKSRKRFIISEKISRKMPIDEEEKKIIDEVRERRSSSVIDHKTEEEGNAPKRKGKRMPTIKKGKGDIKKKEKEATKETEEDYGKNKKVFEYLLRNKSISMTNIFSSPLPAVSNSKSQYILNYIRYAHKDRTIINNVNHMIISDDEYRERKRANILRMFEESEKRFHKVETNNDNQSELNESLKSMTRSLSMARLTQKEKNSPLFEKRNSIMNELKKKEEIVKKMIDTMKDNTMKNFDFAFMASTYKEGVTYVGEKNVTVRQFFKFCSMKKEEQIKNEMKKLSPKDKTYIVKLLEDINYNKWEISEDIISKLKAMVK